MIGDIVTPEAIEFAKLVQAQRPPSKLLLLPESKEQSELYSGGSPLNLFTGEMFQVLHAAMREGFYPNNVLVLSSKYGWLHSDQVVTPYTVGRFDEETADKKHAAIKRTYDRHHNALDQASKIFVGLTGAYRYSLARCEFMIQYSSRKWVQTVVASGYRGTDVQALYDWLRE